MNAVPGWKSIDENEIYTKDEYQQFERQRLEELKYLQQRGLVCTQLLRRQFKMENVGCLRVLHLVVAYYAIRFVTLLSDT